MAKKKTTQIQTEAAASSTGNALFEEATLKQSKNNVLSKVEANNLLQEIEKLKQENVQHLEVIQIIQQNLTDEHEALYTLNQNVQHYTGTFWQRLAHLFQGYGSKIYSGTKADTEPLIY